MKKAEDRRTEEIAVRLTKKEKTRIEKMAKKEYDYPSSWIRKKIFSWADNEK